MNNDVASFQNSTTTPIEIPDSEPQPIDDDIQIINSQDKSITLDDDSDVIIEENTPVVIDIDSDDLEIIEHNSSNTPIVIEDDDRNCVINPLNVLKKKQAELFDIVCQENRLLAQVIEDAINLDASGSMKRIIQRTLIPLYLSCNNTYKESDAFNNTLKKTSILLDTAPHLKYSHIKSLCEILKYVKTKNVCVRQQISPRKRKQKHKPTWTKKKKKQSTSMNQTKENKNKDNTKINNATKETLIEIEIPDIQSISPSSDKENIVNGNTEPNNILHNDSNNIATSDITHNTLDNNTVIDPNNLLRPHYAVTTLITPPEPAKQTVETLEKQIAVLKMELETIEEQEVTDDITSPYIIADSLKSKIVQLYKQLCNLMGLESTKRHEVKLQVVNGHPPGPARCLEEYINNNIDEYGNPPFPDIFEVVRCVERAVHEDRLMWNRKRIVAEAQVLLKHYGHAIQKRRKKRDWRDMVSRCKEEVVDPADLDPALEAKLLKNSRIAKRNEDEIVDRYARLEKENSTNPAFRLSLETAADSDSDNEDIHNNMAAETNIQEAPILNIADSTTNIENIHVLTDKQVSLSVANSESNIQGTSSALNSRNVLDINPQGSLKNSISGSNVINSTNIVESNQRDGSSIINPDLTTNPQNCQILLVNSDNNLPYLHGKVCYFNSTPVLLTRVQDPTDNLGGNLQNDVNNLACNLQSEHNCENTNVLSANLQSEPNFINNSEDNLQNGPNSTNNSDVNLQNGPNSIINSEVNIQNGPNFINNLLGNQENNTVGNLQSKNNFINPNTRDYQQSFNDYIKSVNTNLQENQQNDPIINTSNNLRENLENGPTFKECNQSTVTNIGNLEYKRTIMIDSTGSDTDNERKEHTDVITNTNVKERDKSDVDEVEYKIKVKQEENDVIKLLSELGSSDCVATVFDIEDPFLVIEISDSSDDEG